jgi:hypothetical protein
MPAITATHAVIIFAIMYCVNHITMSEKNKNIVNVIAIVLLVVALFFAPVR